MNIDEALIDKLAHLSKLQFSAEEKIALQKDLQGMIGLVERMNELDTTGVEPLLHINNARNILRADKVGGQLPTKEALKNAPDNDGQFFRVPKVIRK